MVKEMDAWSLPPELGSVVPPQHTSWCNTTPAQAVVARCAHSAIHAFNRAVRRLPFISENRDLEDRARDAYISRVNEMRVEFHSPVYLRHVFDQASVKPNLGAIPAGNDHRESAALRAAVTRTFEHVATTCGYQPYFVNHSAATAHHAGATVYRIPADMKYEMSMDAVGVDMMLIMIDDSPYMDMADVLSYGLPVLTFDFVPVGVPHKEYTYKYTKEGVSVRFRGGSEYTHPVWNHGAIDKLSVPYRHGGRITYSVRVRRCESDPNRLMAFYVPEAWLPSCLATMPERLPCRAKYVYNGVVAFSVFAGHDTDDQGSHVVVFGKVNSHTRKWVSVTTADLAELHRDDHIVDARFTLAAYTRVASATDADRKVGPWLMAHVLKGRSRSLSDIDFISGTVPVKADMESESDDTPVLHPDPPVPLGEKFSYGAPDDDQGHKGQRLAGQCISQGAAVPADTRFNAVAGVEQRVLKYTNETPFDDFAKTTAREFVGLVVGGNAGAAFPLDYSEMVGAKGSESAKERAYAHADLTGGTDDMGAVSVFSKIELHALPAYTRQIFSVDPAHNTELGCHVQSQKSFLKGFPCYTIGRTPHEIGSTMSTFGSPRPCDVVVETDYEKFDASTSVDMKKFVSNAVAMELCHPSQRDTLAKLLDDETVADCVIRRFGYNFGVAGAVLSGSAFTSDSNTLHNMFLTYYVYRKVGLAKITAWDYVVNRCVFHGDDGVVTKPAAISDLDYVSHVGALGFKVKLIPARGGIVTFIGREWMCDHVVGDVVASIASPRRALARLPFSASRKYDWATTLFYKATSYNVTDGDTPLVGDWAKAVLRAFEKYGVRVDNAAVDIVAQRYRVAPYEVGDPALWGSYISDQLGDPGELANWCAALRDHTGVNLKDFVETMPCLDVQILPDKNPCWRLTGNGYECAVGGSSGALSPQPPPPVPKPKKPRKKPNVRHRGTTAKQ